MKQASTQAEKKLRKKGENTTVILILIGFIAAISIIQLIQGAAAGEVGLPSMISPNNLLNIVSQTAYVGVAAMGMALVMIAGGIDLSVGMLTSFGILFIAKGYIDWGMPLAAAIIVAIVLCVALEAAMGFIISRLNVEPFIITLGGMITFRGIALLICNSQEVSIQGALDPFKTNMIEGATFGGLNMVIPVYVILLFVATVLIWWVLKYTKYGRRIYAVGANKQAAYLAGIDVQNTVLSTYILNGLLVGVAAVMLLTRVNTAIITTGQNKEIDIIAAAVVGGVAMSGGKGNAWGVFFGAILLGAIENGMNVLRLQSEWQYVAKGIIIIAAVSAGAIMTKVQTRRQLRQQELDALAEKAAAKAE